MLVVWCDVMWGWGGMKRGQPYGACMRTLAAAPAEQAASWHTPMSHDLATSCAFAMPLHTRPNPAHPPHPQTPLSRQPAPHHCSRPPLPLQEVRILWRISHPSIVQFLGAACTESHGMLLMELMRGGDLASAMHLRLPDGKGRAFAWANRYGGVNVPGGEGWAEKAGA